MEVRGIAVSYWILGLQMIAVLRESFGRLIAGTLMTFKSLIH